MRCEQGASTQTNVARISTDLAPSAKLSTTTWKSAQIVAARRCFLGYNVTDLKLMAVSCDEMCCDNFVAALTESSRQCASRLFMAVSFICFSCQAQQTTAVALCTTRLPSNATEKKSDQRHRMQRISNQAHGADIPVTKATRRQGRMTLMTIASGDDLA